jgi:hypothetical protein
MPIVRCCRLYNNKFDLILSPFKPKSQSARRGPNIQLAVTGTEKERASRWYQTLTCFNSHHLKLARNTIWHSRSSPAANWFNQVRSNAIHVPISPWWLKGFILYKYYMGSICLDYTFILIFSSPTSLMGLIPSIVIFLWFLLLYFLIVFCNCKSLAMSSENNPGGQPYPIMTMKMYNIYTHNDTAGHLM